MQPEDILSSVTHFSSSEADFYATSTNTQSVSVSEGFMTNAGEKKSLIEEVINDLNCVLSANSTLTLNGVAA